MELSELLESLSFLLSSSSVPLLDLGLGGLFGGGTWVIIIIIIVIFIKSSSTWLLVSPAALGFLEGTGGGPGARGEYLIGGIKAFKIFLL